MKITPKSVRTTPLGNKTNQNLDYFFVSYFFSWRRWVLKLADGSFKVRNPLAEENFNGDLGRLQMCCTTFKRLRWLFALGIIYRDCTKYDKYAIGVAKVHIMGNSLTTRPSWFFHILIASPTHYLSVYKFWMA